MKKIKNPALEWYKLKKMLQDKGSLTKKEYTTVLERSVDVLTYMRKQDLNIRDFMMDKSMELIKQLEMVKKINSNLSLDDWGMTALSQEDPPPPTIHEYLGMNFNEPDEGGWKGKLKKYINKKYYKGE